MKGSDKVKTGGIKKLFSRIIKKKTRDKSKGQDVRSDTCHQGQTDTAGPNVAAELDANWSGPRRSNLETTRLPSTGNVQELVDWFEKNTEQPGLSSDKGSSEVEKVQVQKCDVPCGCSSDQGSSHLGVQKNNLVAPRQGNTSNGVRQKRRSRPHSSYHPQYFVDVLCQKQVNPRCNDEASTPNCEHKPLLQSGKQEVSNTQPYFNQCYKPENQGKDPAYETDNTEATAGFPTSADNNFVKDDGKTGQKTNENGVQGHSSPIDAVECVHEEDLQAFACEAKQKTLNQTNGQEKVDKTCNPNKKSEEGSRAEKNICHQEQNICDKELVSRQSQMPVTTLISSSARQQEITPVPDDVIVLPESYPNLNQYTSTKIYISPQPRRRSYYRRSDMQVDNGSAGYSSRHAKVEAYLEDLPLQEVPRCSSLPHMKPGMSMASGYSTLTTQNGSGPEIQQTVYMEMPDSPAISDNEDNESEVTTVVPVDSTLSSSRKHKPVVHYHLSIQNCNGINIYVNSPNGESTLLPKTFQVDDGGALKRLSWVEEGPPPGTRAMSVDNERRRYFRSAPSSQPAVEEELFQQGSCPAGTAFPVVEEDSTPTEQETPKQKLTSTEYKEQSRRSESNGALSRPMSKNSVTRCKSVENRDNSCGQDDTTEKTIRGTKKPQLSTSHDATSSSSQPSVKTSVLSHSSVQLTPEPNTSRGSSCISRQQTYPWHSSKDTSQTDNRESRTSGHDQTSDLSVNDAISLSVTTSSNMVTPSSISVPQSTSSGKTPCFTSISNTPNQSIMSPPLLTATRMLGSDVLRPKPQVPVQAACNTTQTQSGNSASSSHSSVSTKATVSGSRSRRGSSDSVITDILMSECDLCQRDMCQDLQLVPQIQLTYADNAVEALICDRLRPVALVAPNIRENEDSLPRPENHQAATSSTEVMPVIPYSTAPIAPSESSYNTSVPTTIATSPLTIPLSTSVPTSTNMHSVPESQPASTNVSIIQSPLTSTPVFPTTVSNTITSSPLSHTITSPPTSPSNQDIPSELFYIHQLQQYQLQQQQLIEQELLHLEQRQEIERQLQPYSRIHQGNTGASARSRTGATVNTSTASGRLDMPENSRVHTCQRSGEDLAASPCRRWRQPPTSTSNSSGDMSSHAVAYRLTSRARTDRDLVTASSVGGQFRRTRSAPRRIRRHAEQTTVNNSSSSPDQDAHSDTEEDRLPARFAQLKTEIIRLPGVLILTTRRGRLIVHLSRDRPNIEGVVQFMMRHGISRHEYDCKVMPSRLHTGPPSIATNRPMTAYVAQA